MNNHALRTVFGAKQALTLSLLAMLSACANLSTPPAPPVTAQSLMDQAETARKTGSYDQAVALLDQARKTDPANNDVWLEIAQVQFDRKDYPKAINAATEALARSPQDREAHSIMFVSSMRLAVNSLAEIRSDNPMTEDSRSEAVLLVKQLRDTLGQDVLVPPVAAKPKHVYHHHPSTESESEHASAKTEKPTPVANANNGDPFSVLR